MTEFSSLDFKEPNSSGSQPYGLTPTNPDSILSGTNRGTQNIGTGPQIDASNNRILLTNPIDGSSIGIGTIPGTTTGEFGFFSLDVNNNLVMKIVNGTWYVYDLLTAKNVIQMGKLPDGTYNLATAKTGNNISDAIS